MGNAGTDSTFGILGEHRYQSVRWARGEGDCEVACHETDGENRSWSTVQLVEGVWKYLIKDEASTKCVKDVVIGLLLSISYFDSIFCLPGVVNNVD